jgi:CheY-like chemotaxis protein
MTSLSGDLAGTLDAPIRTILLVEDEVLVRMVTVDALQDLGFRVEEAASASEALGKVGVLGGRIDAAIIDVGLPDRRGDALALEIRERFARLPIVIASGYSDSFLEGLDGDALVGFLGKPYDSQQLTSVLDRLGVRMRS